jgi:hypothetical protein
LADDRLIEGARAAERSRHAQDEGAEADMNRHRDAVASGGTQAFVFRGDDLRELLARIEAKVGELPPPFRHDETGILRRVELDVGHAVRDHGSDLARDQRGEGVEQVFPRGIEAVRDARAIGAAGQGHGAHVASFA